MAAPNKLLHFNTLTRRAFKPPSGRKPVWLPNFTLTFLRTPQLPPQFAQFLVPLSMNKLDIKDYLYNAYGIPVLAVRSYIQQQPVQQFKPGPGRAVRRRWFRPRSIKKMTVEMGKREDGKGGKGGGLFVWPDELKEEDLEPWDKKVFDEAREQQQESQKVFLSKDTGSRQPESGWDSVREQARRLREGKEEWRPTWQDLKRKNE